MTNLINIGDLAFLKRDSNNSYFRGRVLSIIDDAAIIEWEDDGQKMSYILSSFSKNKHGVYHKFLNNFFITK